MSGGWGYLPGYPETRSFAVKGVPRRSQTLTLQVAVDDARFVGFGRTNAGHRRRNLPGWSSLRGGTSLTRMSIRTLLIAKLLG